MKRIPIKMAKEAAIRYGATIVCVVAWDAETGMQHVTTYGKSNQECEWAALLGNRIKHEILKWPEEECNASPVRLRASPQRVRRLTTKPYRCSGTYPDCKTMITKGVFCKACEADYDEDPDAFK